MASSKSKQAQHISHPPTALLLDENTRRSPPSNPASRTPWICRRKGLRTLIGGGSRELRKIGVNKRSTNRAKTKQDSRSHDNGPAFTRTPPFLSGLTRFSRAEKVSSPPLSKKNTETIASNCSGPLYKAEKFPCRMMIRVWFPVGNGDGT